MSTVTLTLQIESLLALFVATAGRDNPNDWDHNRSQADRDLARAHQELRGTLVQVARDADSYHALQRQMKAAPLTPLDVIAVRPELTSQEKEISRTNKIAAIKSVRERHLNTRVLVGDEIAIGLGLKQAKDLVDDYLVSIGHSERDNFGHIFSVMPPPR